jgi:type I restriction enzyme S subunit
MRRPLRDLADVHYGKSPSEVVHEDGLIPVVGTGGVYGHAMRPLFQGPAVVVPRKGSLGNPQYMSGPFWAVDTTYAVLPKKGVEARWLHYNLDLFDLTKLNEATGVPSISRDWLYKVEFEDPGEASQQRIAEILSTVDEAIEQTESLIAKTQQIKAGLMHDLFTRGVTSDGQLRPPREEAPQLYKESPLGWIPKEWDCETLDSLLAPIACPMRSGPFGSALLKEELVENGIPLLGIDNVFTEAFVTEYRRFVTPHKFVELSRYAVLPGDLIITIMGTVGRCCVVPEDIGQALSSKHLWTITLDRNKILPELVCWQLNYAPWVKSWFARQSQGAVMDAIQSSTLRTLRLPAPPPSEQLLLRDRYVALQTRLSQEDESLRKLAKIKRGLMQDLLSGAVPVAFAHKPGLKEVDVGV